MNPRTLHVGRILLLSFVLWTGAAPALGQDTIRIWSAEPPTSNELTGPETGDRCVGNVTDPTLTVYHPQPSRAVGAAVLVIPGGGYGVVCLHHEGADVAAWLTKAGYTAAVLKYRLPNGHHEVPFQDAQQALRIMRTRAPGWGVAPDRIGALGFSAGGHLTSTLGTHFERDFSGGMGDHLDVSHRPDFLLLIYPVITLRDDYGHQGSRNNLLGEDAPDAAVGRFSNHLRVSPDTPPAFLVHSGDDAGVPPFNSIAFYTALKQNGVQAELHLFDRGGHGYALAEDSPAAAWDLLAVDWLDRLLGTDQ